MKTPTFYVSLAALMIATATFIKAQIWPWLSAKRDKRSLKKNMARLFYSEEDIKRSRRFYTEPFVQVVDPMGSEEPRALASVKSKLFSTLDDLLGPESEHRYIILLADSGMGKTSALMNYNIRQIRRWRKKFFEVKLIPFGIPDAAKQIENIENKQNTILFLDALDEDTQALRDYHVRLDELMKTAYGFRRVLISCRTQFFPSDEEIPREVATLKVGPRDAGESAEYKFHKLYLSPFTKKQAQTYLRRRYPLLKFKWFDRSRARKMADKIPHLAARPMLLAHIDVIVQARRPIDYAFELYEEMVKVWLKREEGFIKARDQLRRFSELLAVDLYKNRTERKAEHVPRGELSRMAKKWGIPVEDRRLSDYKFSTRSLLNRDADGNYKFAHRSIMEYLYVKRYLDGDVGCLHAEWTDQMKTFYWEMLEKAVITYKGLPLGNIDPDDFLLDENQIKFLLEMAVHGLSLLRSSEVANQRLKAILETVTALCALIIDPDGADDPIVSLISVKKAFNNECDLNPIAIYHHGGLRNTKEAVGLRRHKQAIELIYYGDHVPDLDHDDYIKVLGWLRRENAEGTTIMMPIKQNGEMAAVLISETARTNAFKNNRQLQLIETLKLIGKYLRIYQR